MESTLQTITPYIPKLAIQRLLALQGVTISQAERENFSAAVLLADVSGFTRLTETLAQRGPEGAEEMTRALNGYFGQLIELAHRHGGDIVKFAGDAMLIVWPLLDDRDSLAELTARASLCALAMQTEIGVVEAVPGAPLALHCAIGAGDMAYAYIGGVFGRWEFVIMGDALTSMAEAAHLSSSGEVVLTGEAWSLVRDQARGVELEEGCVRIEAITRAYDPVADNSIEIAAEHEKTLKSFLPGAVRSRIDAGQSGWLAELRQVSVLFVNLPDLNHSTSLERAQETMQALQACMYRFEGSINKLSVDEKGISMVAALGLPPLSHYDDPSRAVGAAMAIHRKLAEMGVRCSIGVTTGRVFCGEVGNKQRREYTIMGDVVNLAARLMQAAKGAIRCDEATYRDCQQNYRFEALEPIPLKGKQGLFVTYTPKGKARLKVSSDVLLVGRSKERQVVAEFLASLVDRREGGRILLEGDAGMGKSALISYAVAQAEASGVRTLIGAGDEVEKATPYQAWKGIFESLFDFEDSDDPQTKRDRVLEWLRQSNEDLRKAPLLGALWTLDLPDSELTAHLEGQARANATQALLISALSHAAASAPLLLVLDDCQWLDSASLRLLERVSAGLGNVMLLLAQRPLGSACPTEIATIRDAGAHFALSAMTPEEALELVAIRLGVAALPEAVSRIILERAGGQPLFIENLGYALRDGGYLVIENEQCHLAPQAGDLRDLKLPTTLQGIIMSRIDRLPPAEQLTLKIASVVGRSFDSRILADIHPVDGQSDIIRQHLADLARQELTAEDEHGQQGDLHQAFKNATTRDVAYNLMLFAQRKQIHQAVAQWYEATFKDDLSPHYPFLAHHWSHADVPAKAAHYLEKAGEYAEQRFAYKEAAGFFEQALGADKQLGDAGEPRRRLRIEQWLGRVFKAMGRQDDARVHLESALELSRSLGDGGAEANVLTSIAHLHSICNQNDLALKWFLEAEAKIREVGDGPELMRCLGLSSRLRFRMGQVAEAVRVSEDAIALARSWEPPLDTSLHQAWLGLLHVTSEVPGLSLGQRLQRGIAYLEEAVPAQRALGDRVDLNNTLNLLGNALWVLGRYPEAREVFEETLALTTELGVKYDEICALINLAIQSHELGRFDDMNDFAQRAHIEAVSGRYPDYGLIALVLRALAQAYLERPADSSMLHAKALEELAGLPKGLQEGLELTVLPYFTERHLLQGELDAALETGLRCWERIEATGVKEYEQKLLTLLGEIGRQLGQTEAARGRFERALDLGIQAGASATIARARLGLALMALDAGDRQGAGSMLGQAREEALKTDSRHLALEIDKALARTGLEAGGRFR